LALKSTKSSSQVKLGRPLEYDLEETLEIATCLFWSKGYEATSLSDLLNATKISKSSFYYAFGSKHQLFEQCLERLRHRQMEQMLIELEQAATGRIFIETFLHDMAETSRIAEQRGGYSIMNVATEFSGRNSEIPKVSLMATMHMIEVLQIAIKRGQIEGVIPEHKDSDTLALFLMSSVTGIRTLVKAKANPIKIEKVVAFSLSALD
jgi:TetR/AcrR family transcriptional regulator, transcriptional repressor for nem operon